MYDAVVLGLGVMGAAALHGLASRGARVLGIEQFASPHDRGSSFGETRLLRVAYGEGAAYTPLMQRSVALWRALEREAGEDLFDASGVLYVAAPGLAFIDEMQTSAARYGVALSDGAGHCARQLFAPPQDWTCLFEPGAGVLRAEGSVAAFLAAARALGAQTWSDTQILGIERKDAKTVLIRTNKGTVEAGSAVSCLGAWTGQFLPGLERLLRLERHVLHWYKDGSGAFDGARGGCAFAVAPGEDVFLYGFPHSPDGTVKLADHYSAWPLADPSERDLPVADAEFARLDDLVARFLPGLERRHRSRACLYTMTPDEHFLLDRHPELPGLVFLAGLSGHGFKFAPVLGEALAQLALGLPLDVDIAGFSLGRFCG